MKLLYNLKINSQNDDEIINYYNKYKGIYSKVIKAAKKLLNDQTYHNADNKSKVTWNIINDSLGRKKDKQNSFPQVKVDNIIIHQPEEIVNEFNKQYINIPKKLNGKFIDNNDIFEFHFDRVLPTIFLEPVSETNL